MNDNVTNYGEFRGRCKEMTDALVLEDASLRQVRGWYLCPIWGKQAHWWCVKPDGTIVDPTVKQFPTAGVGAEYVEFDGRVECEYCHKDTTEEDAYMNGHHAYCSYECAMRDVLG